MAASKRLLLIDDDELLCRTLSEQLADQDLFDAVVSAHTAATGLEKAKSDGPFDVILLDIGLPDADGRETCRALRDQGERAPIIMLTGADTEEDTVTGLDAGANDYVTKPFRLAVLLARLRAHIRQYEGSDDAVFVIGPYKFSPAAKMLQDEAAGRKIKLTEKETGILKYLYRAGEKVVSRETLLGEVWGYNAGVTTHTLETHVYRLRQKIEPDPAAATLLVTEQGGYRLKP